MITDILLILLAFALGYGIFIFSTYFLAKLMMPKIEDDEDFAYPEFNEEQVN